MVLCSYGVDEDCFATWKQNPQESVHTPPVRARLQEVHDILSLATNMSFMYVVMPSFTWTLIINRIKMQEHSPNAEE